MNNFDKFYISEQEEENKIKLAKKEYIEQKVFENFNLSYPKNVEYPQSSSTSFTGNYAINLEKEDIENKIYWTCIVVEKLLKLNNINYSSNISKNPQKLQNKDLLVEKYTEEKLDEYVAKNRFKLERKFNNLISSLEQQNSFIF